VVSGQRNRKKGGIMAHTYTALFYHVTFSTKNRKPWLSPNRCERIWPYMGGIARNNEFDCLGIGGTADHIHMLLCMPPKRDVSKAVQLIKGGSSKWIHETFPDLQDFTWQVGYGAFSVSASLTNRILRYIANQEEHHRSRTFNEEYLALLKKHRVQYDIKYVFD
jgi:putative transposase